MGDKSEVAKYLDRQSQLEESLISVSSGFKSLRMHTQGCHGCQMTRNFVRNSKILIARLTIQPNCFLILLHFGWMIDLAMSIFEFLTKFLSFDTPDTPGCASAVFAENEI